MPTACPHYNAQTAPLILGQVCRKGNKVAITQPSYLKSRNLSREILSTSVVGVQMTGHAWLPPLTLLLYLGE